VQIRNNINGNVQEIATNKNGNVNTATINTETHVPRSEKLATCTNKRSTLLSSFPRKTIEELTREAILSLKIRQVRSGFIPSTILQNMIKLKCRMVMGQENVVFQIDTGSSVNVLPSKYPRNLSRNARKLKIWNNLSYLHAVNFAVQSVTRKTTKRIL